MKPRVMFVGCHPFRHGGNSHFMASLLDRVDEDKFDVIVFAGTDRAKGQELRTHRFPIIEGGNNKIPDYYGDEKLIEAISSVRPNIVVFVGLDLWSYFRCFHVLADLKKNLKFKWVSLFPYDTVKPREDWNKWLEIVDFPCVYSEYGYNTLKDVNEKVRYFRPPLFEYEKFRRYPGDMRQEIRRFMFPSVKDTDYIFGFNANNQQRKDPLRAIRAFFEAKKQVPNIKLYLHMELEGAYNIMQYVKDVGCSLGEVLAKKQGKEYTTEQVVDMYNAIDCYLSTSLQEGLNWTAVEAMLCGTPMLLSDNTAHTELLKLAGIEGIKCDELAFVPLMTESGPAPVESAACNFKDLVEKMVNQAKSGISQTSTLAGEKWINGVSDINALLDEVSTVGSTVLNRVLFAQHSSAGDVLMTTRCFKGLSERYKGLPIDYMTSKQYMDIVEGNPYIDKVIPWNDILLLNYRYVVNPHGERILPGHWGRNSNSLLADFYWRILRVSPTNAMIEQKLPTIFSDSFAAILENNPFVVVHTTGGDPAFRTYQYMKDVCDGLKQRGFFTVQVGGVGDYPAEANYDLRGVLSFKETAWVMARAKYAITVDSFVSHLAGFLGIPQVCLFGSGNHNVVRPVGTVICMVPDYVNYCKGLGPCSAGVRDCPVKCTGIHAPKDVLTAFDNLREGEER